MPRIRTLKPEHRQHRKVGPFTDRVYRLWVSMILEADDHGRLVCDAGQLRAVTWPYDHRVTLPHVEASIQAIAASGMVRLYVVDGVRYAEFMSWRDHQRISHPAEPKLPPWQDSGSLANPPEPSTGKGMEGKGSGREVEGNGKDAAAPLVCAHPSDGFTEFWEAYPAFRHVNKADALKAWCTLKPTPALRQTILAALEAQKQRADWQPHHEGGKYIPHPHRWLGKHRWEDAPPAAQANLLTEKTAGNIDAAQRFIASATKSREAR